MSNKTLKLLLSLFALNLISLYIYLSSHHHRDDRTELPSGRIVRRYEPSPRRQLTLKPWPILPSYLPWTHENSKVAFRSCEAYFGNGFTEIAEPLKRPTSEIRRKLGRGGWFRCSYSETLRSSVCEGGGVRMVPDKILMSRGGEKIENVIGRDENEELPRFEDGALEIEVDGDVERSRIGEKLVDVEFLDRYVPQGAVDRHTMRGLIGSMRLVDRDDFSCSEWIEEPTLLVTRFEYANVFHTVTDWYSAYVASRVAGLPNRPNLIFVDGHCETQLEETWRALFSSVTYAKNLTNPVCFRHVVLSPLGYETALFKGLTEKINCRGASSKDLWQKPDEAKTARISEFGEMIRASFELPPLDRNHQIARRPTTVRNVLFVRREDYLAHPRHGGKVQTRLSNEQEVFDYVRTWAPTHVKCKVNVVDGIFAHMPMKEQVRAVGDADVIVGAHGAGLTHMVSAGREMVVLEVVSSEYRRPHFALIAAWKGLEYEPIYLDGSRADPRAVVERLAGILRGVGC